MVRHFMSLMCSLAIRLAGPEVPDQPMASRGLGRLKLRIQNHLGALAELNPLIHAIEEFRLPSGESSGRYPRIPDQTLGGFRKVSGAQAIEGALFGSEQQVEADASGVPEIRRLLGDSRFADEC